MGEVIRSQGQKSLYYKYENSPIVTNWGQYQIATCSSNHLQHARGGDLELCRARGLRNKLQLIEVPVPDMTTMENHFLYIFLKM